MIFSYDEFSTLINYASFRIRWQNRSIRNLASETLFCCWCCFFVHQGPDSDPLISIHHDPIKSCHFHDNKAQSLRTFYQSNQIKPEVIYSLNRFKINPVFWGGIYIYDNNDKGELLSSYHPRTNWKKFKPQNQEKTNPSILMMRQKVAWLKENWSFKVIEWNLIRVDPALEYYLAQKSPNSTHMIDQLAMFKNNAS